jgi:hypothetical protein
MPGRFIGYWRRGGHIDFWPCTFTTATRWLIEGWLIEGWLIERWLNKRCFSAVLQIPAGQDSASIQMGPDQTITLTNPQQVFWRESDLLQYELDVSLALLPHLASRAMVMKRYPDGADAESLPPRSSKPSPEIRRRGKQ